MVVPSENTADLLPELGSALSALADPLRRQVVTELAQAPLGAERTCASFGFPVSKATLTHHFRVLREAGLITQVDRGNSRAACLRRQEIDERLPGLLNLLVAEHPEKSWKPASPEDAVSPTD